jgi:small subunit ribosomal protein S5
MLNKQRRQRADEFDTEFKEKVLFINRCSKVVKGGRKFSFSALIVIGDGNGHVGYGFAKANEVSDAVRKGSEAAKKNVYTVKTEGSTIPHAVRISHDGADILLRPAGPGTGIVAGSQLRSLIELVGIKDIVAKNLGTSNPANQVHAFFKAISKLKDREECLLSRKGE